MNHSFCSLCTSWGQPFARIWVANNLLHFSNTHAQDPLEPPADCALVPLDPLAAVEAAEKAAELEVCLACIFYNAAQKMLIIDPHN